MRETKRLKFAAENAPKIVEETVAANLQPFPAERSGRMLQRTALFVFALITQSLSAFDESKLAAIQPAMQKAVAAKQAAGIVTLVMVKNRVIHHEATGMADIAQGRKMEKDALFWIASMTKSVNAAAIMILVDEGKLSLDEPASKWLPELAQMKLADGSSRKNPLP